LNKIPQGWLLCDGSRYSRTEYADLYATIGNLWGPNGDNEQNPSFSVPDLRGYFLRGVDGGRGRDPNADDRVSFNGDVVGSRPGSFQWDTFQRHHHGCKVRGGIGEDVGRQIANGASEGGDVRTLQTSPEGGSETRPRNAAVYYIIRS